MNNSAIETKVSGENGRLMKRATYLSVAVAVTLIVIKTFAYLETNSVSLLSTLVDSILDASASLINLFAVRHALVPADEDHRFGHGKAEALAGLFQSAFIAGSALFLLFQAVERLLNPEQVNRGELGIAVMVISIVLTLGLVLYQRHVIRKTNSVAISADSLHYVGDVLVNASVIAALIVSIYFNWIYADGLFAIAIAFFIVYSAWLILRTALADLMDEELGSDEREKIEKIVLSCEGVYDLHELKTRRSGITVFIQLHLDLDKSISLMQAHDISDFVEAKLYAEFPDAEILIHQDPISVPPASS